MLPVQGSKFAQQLFFPFSQMGGRFHHDMHNLMPAALASQFRHAAVAEGQPVTGLGAARDRQCLWPVQRGHLNLCAQRGLWERDRHLAMELRAATLEELVWGDM